MAGIGFELNKILSRKGYASQIQAYAYAGLIGSGPWLIAVVALGVLGVVLSRWGEVEAVRLLFVSVSMIYGLTLVLTGAVQMVVTRFAADEEFLKRTDGIFSAYLYTMAWTGLVFAGIGLALFLGFVSGSMLFRLSGAFLTVLVALIWITGIFLSALKNYHAVLGGFAAGGIASFGMAWGMAWALGSDGVMLGLAMGHAVLLAALCVATFRELPGGKLMRPGLGDYFRKYWDLVLGGFFYNLGIWIDKFLYWWVDPRAEQISGVLYSSPIFDRVVYFSFLTIIPGMAVFLLKVETEFAGHYQTFYALVLKKGTLGQILEAKGRMIESLRESFILLLKIQGFTTVALVLAADRVLDLLGLGAVQGGVFQLSLVGLFMLVIFLSMQTILYYLDKRRDALIGSLVFTLANGGITLVGIRGGEMWYGVGFFVATALSVWWATIRVNRHLRTLEYDTFTSQPVYP